MRVPRTGQCAWTDEQIERLRALWIDGIPVKEIGRRMGLSPNAVIGKAHRIGLSRGSPIRRLAPGAAPAKKRPRPPPPARTLPVLAAPPPPPFMPAATNEVAKIDVPPPAPPAPAPPAPPAPVAPMPAAPAEPIRWSTKLCPYPLNDGRPWRFCDAPVPVGGTYCPEHEALCCVKLRPRPRPLSPAEDPAHVPAWKHW